MTRTLVASVTDTRKNYIINGDMRIAQRGTSFAAIANAAFTVDRFRYFKSGAMVHTATQDSDVPTFAQSGCVFNNSLRLNLTTPDTSIAAGEFTTLNQTIEGYNWNKLAQKPFTLSFWVKATATGIYCVAFRNGGNDRSYVAEYTINAANTWEYKTITVSAPPSAGTWNYTNGTGLTVSWQLAVGTNFQTAPNTWQTGNFLGTSNQVNGVNTGSTDFRITGVMLNEGESAGQFSLFGSDFEGELAACQRYYEICTTYVRQDFAIGGGGATVAYSTMFATTKRAIPAPAIIQNNNAGDLSGGSVIAIDARMISVAVTLLNNIITPRTIDLTSSADAEL